VSDIPFCPSAACLKLYLLHGVRQYTPRTLSKFTRPSESGYAVLYGLGGRDCNRLHFRFITLPLFLGRNADMRLTRAAEYERRLYAAIKKDITLAQCSPSFYALVIHTFPHAHLFGA
jgi:hypothetical protein